MKCEICNCNLIKKGFTVKGVQRFYCKECKMYLQKNYKNNACNRDTDKRIVQLLKEGCGIRSISRILKISTDTVTSRIKRIAKDLKPPNIHFGKEYELDEMCTYVESKNKKRWVAYAMRKDTRDVISLRVGTRSIKTIKPIVDKLILSDAKMIYTDKLGLYRGLIPEEIHQTKKYKTNHIERMNLTLRTHLKRLNRRTICYSKSIVMLISCLKIYFWY